MCSAVKVLIGELGDGGPADRLLHKLGHVPTKESLRR